jgi:hypothetical protein
MRLDAVFCDAVAGKYPGMPREEAARVRQSCANAHEHGSLSCKNPDLQLFVEEADGFDLKSKRVTGTRIDLPRYMPVPDRDSADLELPASAPGIFCVRLGDVVPNGVHAYEGSLRFGKSPRVDTSYATRPIFRGRTLLLFSSGPDALVNGLMRDRDQIDLFNELRSLGLAAATSIDLSVNLGDCYVGQMLNINRGLTYATEMEKAGIPAIPNIYAFDTNQRTLWAEFLVASGVRLVSINCRMQRRKPSDIAFVKETIRFLMEQVGADLHIILHGFPLSRRYVTGLGPYFSRLHFADSAPFYKAHMGEVEFFNPVSGNIEQYHRKATDRAEMAAIVQAGIAARENFLLSIDVRRAAFMANLSTRVV